MRNDDGGKRPRLLQRHPLLLGLQRLFRDIARHRARGFRHPAQILIHQLHGLRRIEIADEHHGRVLRHVIGAVELAHVIDRRRLQILHAADRRVHVGMNRERLGVDDLVQAAVRLVVDAHPALFLHDVAFRRERVLVYPQRRHSIGFEPQDHRQVLRRQRFPEHRFIVGRIGIALAADAGNHRRVLLRPDVFRALEHQVLEKVREACASRFLVLGADVIPKLQVHDRRRMVFFQDEREAVCQSRDLVLQLRRPDRGR